MLWLTKSVVIILRVHIEDKIPLALGMMQLMLMEILGRLSGCRYNAHFAYPLQVQYPTECDYEMHGVKRAIHCTNFDEK